MNSYIIGKGVAAVHKVLSKKALMSKKGGPKKALQFSAIISDF